MLALLAVALLGAPGVASSSALPVLRADNGQYGSMGFELRGGQVSVGVATLCVDRGMPVTIREVRPRVGAGEVRVVDWAVSTGEPEHYREYGSLDGLADGLVLSRGVVRDECRGLADRTLLVELESLPPGSLFVEGFDVVHEVGGEERVLRVDTTYFMCDGDLDSAHCDEEADAAWYD